jgi:hypothetical protein
MLMMRILIPEATQKHRLKYSWNLNFDRP